MAAIGFDLPADHGAGRPLTPWKNVDLFCGHMRGATEAVYYGALPFMMLDGPLPALPMVSASRSAPPAPAASRAGRVRGRRRPGR
jgi:hypothetical protein